MSFIFKYIHAELYLAHKVIIDKVTISIFAGFEGYLRCFGDTENVRKWKYLLR